MKIDKWKTGKRWKPRDFFPKFSILSIGPKSKSRKRKSKKKNFQRFRRFRVFDLAFFFKLFQFYWSMVIRFVFNNDLNNRKIQTIPKNSVLFWS